MVHVRKILEKMSLRIPDKEIIIGETGWSRDQEPHG
jgi:hypothetical protein